MLDPNKKPSEELCSVTEQVLLDLPEGLLGMSTELILKTISLGQQCREMNFESWRMVDEKALILYKAEMNKRFGIPEGLGVTYINADDLGIRLSGEEDQNQNYMEN